MTQFAFAHSPALLDPVTRPEAMVLGDPRGERFGSACAGLVLCSVNSGGARDQR